MCDDYKGVGSDIRLHRSGGYNLTFVKEGQCLSIAISIGSYDWISQARTNHMFFAAEYATEDSGPLTNIGYEECSDSENADDVL
eukprot:2842895-Karenia_brevis.AAC.1